MFLFPVIAFAGNDFNGRYTKTKKINKEFTVSPNALLEIDNSYGKIDIKTWDQNRVVIEVVIKTNGNDEEEVLERLKEISVDFDASRSHVSAQTLLEERNSSWWQKLLSGWNNNVNIEINYTIRAPVTNSVNLDNDYGSIYLDKLEGNAQINCDYGRLFIGQLLGENNSLNFDYTRGSHIDYIKKGKINADYSEFTIDEAETLELSADYSESKINKVENIAFNCDYGSLTLGKVRNIQGRGDYLRTNLGAVYNSAEVNMDYGSLAIEKIMASAENIAITTDYTSVKIGYEPDTPFSFEVSMQYGNLNGIDEEGFEIMKRRQENTEQYYKGYHISPNEGPMIKIETEYGNVTFED